MDKPQTENGLGVALGITSTTLSNAPLDAAYLDTLFAADPDEIELLPDQPPAAPTDKKPDQPTAADKKQAVKPENKPATFLGDTPDFIEGLDKQVPDPDGEASAKAQPAAAPPKPEEEAAPAPGEEAAKATGATPILDSHITDFTRELFGSGILTPNDENDDPAAITTPEALAQRFHDEKQKGAVQILENILSHFGPEYRDAFNAIYINGVAPKDYFIQAQTLDRLADLDLSKVENQRYVISQFYKKEGWDAAKIQAKIEKLEGYQDLEEEARDIYQILLSKEKQALLDIEQEKKDELARKATMDKEYQGGIERILRDKLKAREIDGIPLDEKTVQQLASYMLQKKWQLGDQQISDYEKDILDLTRPENRELQIKVALMLHLFKTDPTLSRLQRKVITTQSDKMFSFLQREQSTAKKQGKKTVNFFDD